MPLDRKMSAPFVRIRLDSHVFSCSSAEAHTCYVTVCTLTVKLRLDRQTPMTMYLYAGVTVKFQW
jgi:hypothetical protein